MAIDSEPAPWVQVEGGLAAHGFTLGPESLALAFVGWQQGFARVTVARPVRGGDVFLGLQGTVSKPLILDRGIERLVNYVDDEGEWTLDVSSYSILARPGLSLRFEGTPWLQPYGTLITGADHLDVMVAYSGPPGSGSVAHDAWGLRLGFGLGATIIPSGTWETSFELDWSQSMGFGGETSLAIADASGQPIADFSFGQERWPRPPVGFAWSVSVGRRF